MPMPRSVKPLKRLAGMGPSCEGECRMQNDECRMAEGKGPLPPFFYSSFCILHSSFPMNARPLAGAGRSGFALGKQTAVARRAGLQLVGLVVFLRVAAA